MSFFLSLSLSCCFDYCDWHRGYLWNLSLFFVLFCFVLFEYESFPKHFLQPNFSFTLICSTWLEWAGIFFNLISSTWYWGEVSRSFFVLEIAMSNFFAIFFLHHVMFFLMLALLHTWEKLHASCPIIDLILFVFVFYFGKMKQNTWMRSHKAHHAQKQWYIMRNHCALRSQPMLWFVLFNLSLIQTWIQMLYSKI